MADPGIVPNPPRAPRPDQTALERRAAGWRRVAIGAGVLAFVLAAVVDLYLSPSDVTGRGTAAYVVLWHVPGVAFFPDPENPVATGCAWASLAAFLVAVVALAARTVLLRRLADLRRADVRTSDPRTRRRARRAREKVARAERRATP